MIEFYKNLKKLREEKGISLEDINKRTKFDASISSGLAVMACNRHLYTPVASKQKKKLNLPFHKL